MGRSLLLLLLLFSGPMAADLVASNPDGGALSGARLHPVYLLIELLVQHTRGCKHTWKTRLRAGSSPTSHAACWAADTVPAQAVHKPANMLLHADAGLMVPPSDQLLQAAPYLLKRGQHTRAGQI